MSLNTGFTSELGARIDQLKADRVYKRLNHLDSPQSARVQMEGRGEVLILSSNNYLGLCDEPSVVEAEINPVIVRPIEQGGVVAVDALVRVA